MPESPARHALAIVNRGGATAAEVIALKNEIQARVREVFLCPEPVLVGFEGNVGSYRYKNKGYLLAG